MVTTCWAAPGRMRLLFLVVMILLASAFGCGAWWLLEQDRQLSSQRVGECQEAGADLVTAMLDKRNLYLESLQEQTLFAVVGEGMRGTPGVSGRIFQTLGRNNINISAIAQGGSERNISFAIRTPANIW